MAAVSFRIDDLTKVRLDRLVEERSLNPSAIFRQALESALNEVEFGPESRRAMNLTLPDRLKLANQYEILSHLKPDKAQEFQVYIQVLKQGFDIQYAHLVKDFSDGLSDAECAEVLGILDMHSVIAAVLINSNQEIPEAWWEFSRFKGFDESSEYRHHSFARFLIYDVSHYPLVRDVVERYGLSSGLKMLPCYRRMLNKWIECQNRFNPTIDEVHDIILDGWGREVNG